MSGQLIRWNTLESDFHKWRKSLDAVYANDGNSPAPVAADARPDGTVTLKGGSVAAGIGYTWGSGELNFGQGSHEFAIHGVSVVAH
jgi:hypothetical protein